MDHINQNLSINISQDKIEELKCKFLKKMKIENIFTNMNYLIMVLSF